MTPLNSLPKIWDATLSTKSPDTAIIYIDRHLITKALLRKLSLACAPKP